VVAEVELHDADEEAAMPPWLAPVVVRDVTGDSAFSNATLASSHNGSGRRKKRAAQAR